MPWHIRAESLLWLALLLAVARPAAADVSAACEAYGRVEAVFVGRARPEIKHRLTWNFGIEEAREKVARATAEYESNRAFGSGARTGSTRDRDLFIQKLRAEEALDNAKVRTPPPQDMMLTPMDVEIAFRGVSGPVAYAAQAVRMSKDGEPLPLEPGRAYLVYGQYLGPQGHMSLEVIRAVEPVVDVESAEEDLQFLHAVASTANGATVYGTLELEHLEGNARRARPLAGVTIRFSWSASEAEVTTGADGSFRLSGISPGPVNIEPALPAHLMVPAHALRFNATAGGCFPRGLRAVLNGRVRGSVVRENGAPFAGVQVDLVPVDSERARNVAGTELASTRTNEHGVFEFSGQPPGSYWLGMNLWHSPSTGVPYPPTYFPGTTNRDLAEPVVIGEGTEHDGFSFFVNSALARAQLEILVETGRQPQSEVYACLSQPGAGGAAYQKKEGQPLLVDVVEGGEYRVSVHADTPAGHFHAEPVTFTGVRGRTSMTVKAALASTPHNGASKCDTPSR